MRNFLRNRIIFLILCLILKDADTALLDCQIKGNQLNKQVVPMCFDNAATSNYLIISTFKAKESSTNPCSCTLTSTSATSLSFISHVQPNYQNCGNVISVTSQYSSLYFNCFASGTMQVQAGESVQFALTKPTYSWDERFCIGIQSGNALASLTLSCNGQSLTQPETTTTTTSTTTMEPTTTTPSTTKPTTTTQTTIRPTTTKPATTTQATTPTTTIKKTTTVSSTTMQPTEPRTTTVAKETSTQSSPAATTRQTSDAITTKVTLRPTSQLSPTTRVPPGGGNSSNQKNKERSEDIPWNYIIPLAAIGFSLLIIIIIACCLYSRRKHRSPYELSNPETAKPAPYSNLNPGYTPKEEMLEIVDNQLYKSVDVIEDGNGNTNTVNVTDIKREMDSSTGDRTSGTFVRCEVLPPEEAHPVYAAVDRSKNESQSTESSPREATPNNQNEQVFY